MKRPAALYLVTAWLCLGVLFQLTNIGRLGRYYTESGQPSPLYLDALTLAALVFAFWLIVGLIRLRPVQRWLSVAFFAYWGIGATWGMFRSALASHPSLRVWLVLAMIWLFVFCANLASIAYLSRRRFREFAAKYVEEKKHRGIREYAEKQTGVR